MTAAFDEDKVGQLLLGQGQDVIFFPRSHGIICRTAETDGNGTGFAGPVRIGAGLAAGDGVMAALDIGDLIAAVRQFRNG